MRSDQLTSQLFLPSHLCKHVLHLVKEIRDLTALFVSLSCVVCPSFGLLGEILADFWDRKDNALHASVLSYNLNLNYNKVTFTYKTFHIFIIIMTFMLRFLRKKIQSLSYMWLYSLVPKPQCKGLRGHFWESF